MVLLAPLSWSLRVVVALTPSILRKLEAYDSRRGRTTLGWAFQKASREPV